MARRVRAQATTITTITIASWVEMFLRRGDPCPLWANREGPWRPHLRERRQTAATPRTHPTPWWARRPSSTRDQRNGRRRCEEETADSQFSTLLILDCWCWTPLRSRSWPLCKLTADNVMKELNWWEEKKIFCIFHVCFYEYSFCQITETHWIY